MLEIAFRPDPRSREPLYRQLAAHLQSLIESERLRPGEKLPATRELAVALGVSRNTVNGAYQLLLDADLVHSHVGQGTFVQRAPIAGGVRGGALRAAPEPDLPRPFVWEGLFSTAAPGADLTPTLLGPRPARVRFDLRPGRVIAESLPARDLRRSFARALDQGLPRLANHHDAHGWRPLRRAIAERLVARGVHTSEDDVVIVSGAQQALDLLARILIEPGDAVAIEAPGYFGATFAFRAARAQLVPIPVDERGLRTDALARLLERRRVKCVYTTPAVQSPTGVRLADERRARLLELAEATQTPVVEDDYDGEMRIDDPLVPALKTLDRVGQVLLVGTFSKALFPALRLGYVVAPPPVVRRLVAAKLVADFGTSTLDQAALADWLAAGGMDRHVRRVRREVVERVDALVETLAGELPEGCRCARPAGGTHLWLELAPDVDAGALATLAADEGIALGHGAAFRPGGDADPDAGRALILSVSGHGPGELREAATRLAACARTVRERAAAALSA